MPIPIRTKRSEPVQIPVNTTSIPDLRIADRCDRCGARAYVAARIGDHETPLMFCAHHFRRWESRIRAAASEVLDQRWRLEREELARRRDGVS